MRPTIHNGRFGKDGAYKPEHLDRDFPLSHAEHIDPERSKDNWYWNYSGISDISFKDAEAIFYENHCADYLKKKMKGIWHRDIQKESKL